MSNKNDHLLDEHPILILPTLAEILGLNNAIVIQQVHYWLKNNEKNARDKKATHFFEERWWCYNTYKEWQTDNFRWWSVRTIERIFLDLTTKKLLDSRYREQNNEGMWWSINYDILKSLTDLGYDNLADPKDEQGMTTWQTPHDKLSYPPRQVVIPLSTTDTTEITDTSLNPVEAAVAYTNTATPTRVLRAVPKPTRPEKEKKSNWKNKNSKTRAEEVEEDDMPTRRASLPTHRANTSNIPAKTQEAGKMKESDALSDWWCQQTGRKQIATDANIDAFQESFLNPQWREAAEEIIAKAVEGSMNAYGRKPKDTTLVDRLQNMDMTYSAFNISKPKIIFAQFPMEDKEDYEDYKVRMKAIGITHESWESEND